MENPKPKDHGEEVAIFRHGLIGELAIRADSLDHGERSEELRRLSVHRVRAPGSDTTRQYSVATLGGVHQLRSRFGLEAVNQSRSSTRHGTGWASS